MYITDTNNVIPQEIQSDTWIHKSEYSRNIVKWGFLPCFFGLFIYKTSFWHTQDLTILIGSSQDCKIQDFSKDTSNNEKKHFLQQVLINKPNKKNHLF